MPAARILTLLLIALLVLFGVLQLLGVQPGFDNHRWLLYLFVLAWPVLSLSVLGAAISIIKARPREAFAALGIAVLSLTGFAVWGHVYAGFW